MVSVTKKYQVTIPKQIREELGIKAGDNVVFLKKDLGRDLSEYARDYMIGSLAVKLKCPLITSNINDFEWMSQDFLVTPEKLLERFI